MVDHENRNQLDDRIENLRAATHSENSRNRTSHKNSSSKYLGVSWFKNYQKWKACIEVNDSGIFLGNFELESDAALAYNKAAVKYFKEFANLNIIQNMSA